MKLPKRFALSTLMLAMLVVAVVFGYAQWRRLELVSQVRSLNESGIYFVDHGDRRGMGWSDVKFRVTDDFWARVEPQAIGVMISIDRFGKCSLTGRSKWTTLDDAEVNLKEVCHTLQSIGITDVDFNIWDNIGYGYHAGPSAELGFLRATHSEWSSRFRDPNDLYFWEKGPDWHSILKTVRSFGLVAAKARHRSVCHSATRSQRDQATIAQRFIAGCSPANLIEVP